MLEPAMVLVRPEPVNRKRLSDILFAYAPPHRRERRIESRSAGRTQLP